MPRGARARRCMCRSRPSTRRRAARPRFAGGGLVPRTRPVLRRYRHERRRARHEERNRATPSERRATSADIFVTVQDMSAAPDRRRMSVVQVLPALEMGGVERSTQLAWDVGAKRLSTLRWIPRLRRFLRDERPDVLHLRSRLPAWMAYWAWKGLPAAERPALVTTVHGFYTPGRYSSV